MKYKIVLVPFPFDGFSYVKVRPAVCLTNTTGEYQHIIIAFISSRVSSANEQTDIFIKDNSKDFSFTGLKVSSVIRLHRLISIPKSIIKRELGALSSSYQAELNKKLKQLFQLK